MSPLSLMPCAAPPPPPGGRLGNDRTGAVAPLNSAAERSTNVGEVLLGTNTPTTTPELLMSRPIVAQGRVSGIGLCSCCGALPPVHTVARVRKKKRFLPTTSPLSFTP